MKVQIEYRDQKDLPCKELYQLFLAVGWAAEDKTTQAMIDHFNVGFLNSTFVFSAWMDGRLVGCVRALSDLHFRSVIYDLAVMPEYQQKGIGKELVRRCINACENSEWLVQTDMAKGFYEKIGFKENKDSFLTIPCKWF
ncbi:MAG: GNAT family N-acetyltransferase [Lachnospiraceae bacterium]|nr:GNAT family N-acetyltransferase [Lachnospiraceae bacterium]